jgi:hypothetical protein
MGRIYVVGVEMALDGVFIHTKKSHIDQFRRSEIVRWDTHADMQTQHS